MNLVMAQQMLQRGRELIIVMMILLGRCGKIMLLYYYSSSLYGLVSLNNSIVCMFKYLAVYKYYAKEVYEVS